ncbi:MAG: hypothetical protein JW708_03115 [Vallitaleaceae bacterium]|nr:hypothetical protein [Vallitaleaceae bacterium]
MMMDQVIRSHYRGSIRYDVQKNVVMDVIRSCEKKAQACIEEGRIMTVALYYYGSQLFLYVESIGEEVDLRRFTLELEPYLDRWPGKEELRYWVPMHHIYCHAYPKGKEDWRRKTQPEMRRGRIAKLKPEAIFSYLYHHKAIVDEGLLMGDKYQSIGFHEDLLFSYFEEPKILTNVSGDVSKESEAIKAWTAVNPEAHFIPYPEANGMNFLFLPAYFALG